MGQPLASPFKFTFIEVPQYTSPIVGGATVQPEQYFRAPEIDEDAPQNAWWYISISAGVLHVHPGSGISTTPYALAPGGFLRVHRENMPEFILRNTAATTVIGVVVYTGDPNFEYRYQG